MKHAKSHKKCFLFKTSLRLFDVLFFLCVFLQHKLQECTELSKRLEQETNSRKELLERIDAETSQVEKERRKAEKINKKLKQQLDDYKVPEVMDYVTEKADVYELQKKVKSWERKLEIAEV